ncbi:MAG: 50S ribosomal protein L29 [Bacteroidia bacterium]|nr:MAG: 50S ribosomal protein L29 [Bacteroidia bacterium]
MKYSEIKELTKKEILERLEKEQVTLTTLRLDHKVNDLSNPQIITETKKNIARMKTELRQRELNENQS